MTNPPDLKEGNISKFFYGEGLTKIFDSRMFLKYLPSVINTCH